MKMSVGQECIEAIGLVECDWLDPDPCLLALASDAKRRQKALANPLSTRVHRQFLLRLRSCCSSRPGADRNRFDSDAQSVGPTGSDGRCLTHGQKLETAGAPVRSRDSLRPNWNRRTLLPAMSFPSSPLGCRELAILSSNPALPIPRRQERNSHKHNGSRDDCYGRRLIDVIRR